MSSRAIGALLLAVVLLVFAGAVLLQGGGGAKPPEGGRDGAAPGLAGAPPDSRVAHATPGRGKPTARREKTGERAGAATTEEASDEPVVARGRVLLPQGLELDGLEVALFQPNGEELATVDPESDGRFELRCDAYLLAGWTVSTSWFGVSPKSQDWVGRHVARAIHIVPAAHAPGTPPIECDLVVGEAARFEGRVIDRATGEPIEGAIIGFFTSLTAYRENPLEEATTDAEGKYELTLEDLPARELVVICRADEHQSEIAGPLDAVAGSPRRLDFSLGAGQTIRGRVVDETTGAGVGLAYVSIAPIDYPIRGDRAFAVVDAQGAFEIEFPEIPAERSLLRVEARGFAPAILPAKEVHDGMEVRLRKGVVLSGRIVDRDGKPVSGARVDVARGDEWNWDDPSFKDSARTDGEGKFKIELTTAPADEAVVFVEYFPYRPIVVPLAKAQLPASSATTREVELVLERGAPASKPAK